MLQKKRYVSYDLLQLKIYIGIYLRKSSARRLDGSERELFSERYNLLVQDIYNTFTRQNMTVSAHSPHR